MAVIIINFFQLIKFQIKLCLEQKCTCAVYIGNNKYLYECVVKVYKEIILYYQNFITKCYIAGYNSQICFANGSKIHILHSVDNGIKGFRVNHAIIDDNVNLDIMHNIIKPSLINNINYKPYSYCNIQEDIDKYYKELDNMRDFYENIYNKEKLGLNNCAFEKEVNNRKVMIYKACGIEKIQYETEFINKTKETFLNVYGKCEIPICEYSEELKLHIYIDTNIYEGYEVKLHDGLLYVELVEIQNNKPELHDYSSKNNLGGHYFAY